MNYWLIKTDNRTGKTLDTLSLDTCGVRHAVGEGLPLQLYGLVHQFGKAAHDPQTLAQTS